jgi:class 3 adenylate cyclase
LAALGIQDEAKRLAVEVDRRDGVDLRLRVGLNSGQVIAGEIGSVSLLQVCAPPDSRDTRINTVRRRRMPP